MRSRIGPWLGAASFLLLAGCASQPRPCVIIPMQLKMAAYDRDQIKAQVDAKMSEVKRTKENLDLATTRLQQMEQERDDLLKTVQQQAADSAAAATKGKK